MIIIANSQMLWTCISSTVEKVGVITKRDYTLMQRDLFNFSQICPSKYKYLPC